MGGLPRYPRKAASSGITRDANNPIGGAPAPIAGKSERLDQPNSKSPELHRRTGGCTKRIKRRHSPVVLRIGSEIDVGRRRGAGHRGGKGNRRQSCAGGDVKFEGFRIGSGPCENRTRRLVDRGVGSGPPLTYRSCSIHSTGGARRMRLQNEIGLIHAAATMRSETQSSSTTHAPNSDVSALGRVARLAMFARWTMNRKRARQQRSCGRA